MSRSPEEILADLEAARQQIRDLPHPAEPRYSSIPESKREQVEADWMCYHGQINTLKFRHDYILRKELLIASMAEAGLAWCSYHWDVAPIANVHKVWITQWVSMRGCDQGGNYFGTDEHTICFDIQVNFIIPKDFSYTTVVPSGAISAVYDVRPTFGYTQCSGIPTYPGFPLLEKYDIPRPLGL